MSIQVISKEQVIRDLIDTLPNIPSSHRIAQLYSEIVGVKCAFNPNKGEFTLNGRVSSKYNTNKLNKVLKKFTDGCKNKFGKNFYEHTRRRKVTQTHISQSYCFHFLDDGSRESIESVTAIVREICDMSVKDVLVQSVRDAQMSKTDRERAREDDIRVTLTFDINDFIG